MAPTLAGAASEPVACRRDGRRLPLRHAAPPVTPERPQIERPRGRHPLRAGRRRRRRRGRAGGHERLQGRCPLRRRRVLDRRGVRRLLEPRAAVPVHGRARAGHPGLGRRRRRDASGGQAQADDSLGDGLRGARRRRRDQAARAARLRRRSAVGGLSRTAGAAGLRSSDADRRRSNSRSPRPRGRPGGDQLGPGHARRRGRDRRRARGDRRDRPQRLGRARLHRGPRHAHDGPGAARVAHRRRPARSRRGSGTSSTSAAR